jgi:hypothetical protein
LVTGELGRRSICSDWMALIDRAGAPAQKSAGSPKTCGKKDTAAVSQRGIAV